MLVYSGGVSNMQNIILEFDGGNGEGSGCINGKGTSSSFIILGILWGIKRSQGFGKGDSDGAGFYNGTGK